MLYNEFLGFSQPSSEFDNKDPELQSFTGRVLDIVNRQRLFVTNTGLVRRTYDGEVISEETLCIICKATIHPYFCVQMVILLFS